MRCIAPGFTFSIFIKKHQKNRFLRGQGECPKSQKKWSKTHFFPSVQKKNRTKSGQKVVFPGGRVGPSKWPPEAVFSQLCCGFYKKLLHRAILIVRAYADALQIFKIMESTTKLVTAHAESIFQLRLCDFKNRVMHSCGFERWGLKIAFMSVGHVACIHGALLE